MFVQLPGVQKPQFLLAKGQYMGEVIDAIIAKFKLDFTPQQLVIFKLQHSCRTILDFTQTLNDAGVHAGTKLVVELAAAQMFAVSSGVCEPGSFGRRLSG